MGGGILVNVAMLALHIYPEVVPATTSCLVVFTSSLASILYLISGLLIVDYAILAFFIGLFGSGVGIIIVKRAIDKTNRASIVVILFSIIIVLSAISITTYGVISVVDEEDFDFKDFC